MLPSSLPSRLTRAPRLVVAPVGLGFAQEALSDWAARTNRIVARDPGAVTDEPTLLIVPRRSALDRLPLGWTLDDVWMLSENDVTFSESDWRAALQGVPVAFAEATFRESNGWPRALAFAARLAPNAPSLAGHPLVRADLVRSLPSGTRDVAARLAASPVVLPAVLSTLDVSAAEVAELFDLGVLFDPGSGPRLPSLLRAVLLNPSADLAPRVAAALLDAGRVQDALDVLAEAGDWDAYLALLARTAKASLGEDALRALLRRVPEVRREHPGALYLSGLLARVRGEFAQAERCYREAAEHADARLTPIVHNARGVTLALQGRADEALGAFDAATRTAPLASTIAGEAWHNRAGLLLQASRFAEAEASLREATAAFRASGDEAREATTLQLLGTFYVGRGLLPEARAAYEDALNVLARLGQSSTALVRANFAEVLCLIGDLERAEAQLEAATRSLGSAPDARAEGWTHLNTALLCVTRGDLDAAERQLRGVLLGAHRERSLLAEAHLLLARVHRLRGELDLAVKALEGASSLGLRANLEAAVLRGEGFEDVQAQARHEEARLELAVALLHGSGSAELREALDLIRAHRMYSLLSFPSHASRLVTLAEEDEGVRDLFPIHLRLLGTFSVRFLGRDVRLADFPTRKSAALLLTLALGPGRVPREELAERFWPDAKNPASNLQTAIYHLRATLGASVVRSERGLLSLAFPVRSDLAALEDVLANAERVSPDERLRDWPRLLRHAGRFLPEFPEDFEDRRAAAEEVVRRLRLDLAEAAPPTSDLRLQLLRDAVADDPYDVATREAIIAVYTARGDFDGALTEREALRRVERELRG